MSGPRGEQMSVSCNCGIPLHQRDSLLETGSREQAEKREGNQRIMKVENVKIRLRQRLGIKNSWNERLSPLHEMNRKKALRSSCDILNNKRNAQKMESAPARAE